VCYFVTLEVVLQRDRPAARATFQLPEIAPLRYEGAFPRWSITDGHCSCGLVRDGGASVNLPGGLPGALLADENVKRVHLWWSWGDEPPHRTEVRLSLDELERRNAAGALAPSTRYRINDPRKYRR